MKYRHHGNVSVCDDCKLTPPTRTYGLGSVRCDARAKVFDEDCHAKRLDGAKLIREALRAHVEAGCPDDGVVCSDCCEHEYDVNEGGMCINCGDDGVDYWAGVGDDAMDAMRDGS